MMYRLRKNVLRLLLILICFMAGKSTSYGQTIEESSAIEQKLIKDALKNIKHLRSHKKGQLERISCCYTIAGEMPLSASIKTFYVDYRKKPDSTEYLFKNTLPSTPDQVIEIIFKSNEKNKLSIIRKNPKKNKRYSCKYVSII